MRQVPQQTKLWFTAPGKKPSASSTSLTSAKATQPFTQDKPAKSAKSADDAATSAVAAELEAAPPPTKRQRVIDDSDSETDTGVVPAQQATIAPRTAKAESHASSPMSELETPSLPTADSAALSATASVASTPRKRRKDVDRAARAIDAEAQLSDTGSSASASASDVESDLGSDRDLQAEADPVKREAKAAVIRELPDEKSMPSWPIGKDVPYSALCEVFDEVSETRSRLLILKYMTRFFVDIIRHNPQELVYAVYLSLNRLGPEYEGKELGLGESILLKAIAQSTGREVKMLKADLQRLGDLGEVAVLSRGKQRTMFKPKPLTLRHVFKTLSELASITGSSSQAKKVDKINSLLVGCTDNQAKYLIRSCAGKLRIGLAEQTILPSLAQAFTIAEQKNNKLPSEEKLVRHIEIVKQVFSELPNYDRLIEAMLTHGVANLAEHCELTPGIPLKPMLAHPTKSLTEVLDRFENMMFTCEYKYDGERAQIHRTPAGQSFVYSRNSENLSQKYPDILSRIASFSAKDADGNPKAKSFVLDCEAVAWDRQAGKILPFQVLSTRKRKNTTDEEIAVQVCVFAFDLLYLNGEALTRKTLRERRALLYEHFEAQDGRFAFAVHSEGSNVNDIQEFLDASIVDACEGLMVKTLDRDASYEPSRRSRNWLKVKKDYLSGVGDSLDLVVIGGYIGKGKRTGWYGGYLLACYDEESEAYQAICKVGTGFSEENLKLFSETLQSHIISGPRSYYEWTDHPLVRPDVWFEPKLVFEIKAADLSLSPVHKAAYGHIDSEKGISLRFPRFLRLRDDKAPEQATNATQVADLFRAQNRHGDDKDKD